MAYIIQKKTKNNIYYYMVHSARINGKPRIISKKYLGTAEKIAQSLSGEVTIPEPEYSTVLELGAILALYNMAERLGIRSIIDRHVLKRDQGLPVSDSILLAAINRAVMPRSKNSFYDWFQDTILPSFFKMANKNSLSSQGFWNNMSQLDQRIIQAIEDDITKQVVKQFEIRTDCLLFDNTNFYTYIDTDNPATLAARGHSKEKRSDLKIIGLSLMVSPDYNIPLFHETYPGNKNDAKQFSEIIEKLKQRYKKLGLGICNATLVFDRGNNGEDNVEDILKKDPLPFHFVGGLKLNQCPELLEVALQDLYPLNGSSFKKTRVFRSTKKVFGREFTVVMTFNPELYISQMRGIKNNIKKCMTQLKEAQDNLEKWRKGEVSKGRKPGKKGVANAVSSILSAEHMKDIFICEIKMESGFVSLSFKLCDESFAALRRNYLGRSILFTDHSEWTNEQIVSAYRSQYHVEEAFKRMKDTDYLTFRPIYHFTDSKIRVHAFYCVLALLLTSLLNRELADMGYKVSINSMLDSFQHVRQIITYFPKNHNCKNNAIVSYSGIEGIAKVYFDKYKLLSKLGSGTT